MAHALKWAAVCWFVVFWRLGWLSLLDPDEAHYAELTHEMVQRHSWLVPLLDGVPYIDKPVLFHWLQGAAVLLFGETEFAMRLPSACAAVSLFAITRWVGAAVFGAEAGEWGALMFATVPATFALSGIGLFDMVYTALLFGGTGVLIVSALHRRTRLQYVGFLLLALAVLTKGPVALLVVALFTACIALASDEGRRLWCALHWKRGVACILVLSTPWFAWMYAQFGSAFVTGYLLAGNLWYFTQPSEFSTRIVHHTFYLRTYFGAFFPWSLVTLGAAIDVVRRRRAGQVLPPGEVMLWAWAITIFGFFTIARFKLDHYVFPAAPACCLLAAHAWRQSMTDRQARAARAGVLTLGLAMIAMAAVSGVALFRIDLGLPIGAAVLPIALAAGGAIVILQMARREWLSPRTIAAPVIALLVVYATAAVAGFPALERTHPITITARFLHEHTAPGDPIGLYRLERWRASLRYYIGRRIERLDGPNDVRRFLAASDAARIVMLRTEYDALRSQGIDVREISSQAAVGGTVGLGIRRQLWTRLVVARGTTPSAP
jgi:4-amino-4-deoxy-L-arabinose transferase-like glycosyltransferase